MRGTLATLLLALVSFFGASAFAQKPIDKLSTKSGILSAQALIGTACAPLVQCRAVTLNDKILVKDAFASIQFAYPSASEPKLVGVFSGTGGNACCWRTDLIDFTVTPPLMIGDIGDGKLSDAANGVQIVKTSGTNAYGDKIVTTYNYAWGSGRLSPLTQATGTTNGPPGASESPNDILSNTKIREPLFNILGPKYFAEFRLSLGVSEPTKTFDSRYIVGSGCMPHSCCASASVFVIDIVESKAWALQLHNNGCREGANKAEVWGTLSPTDVVPKRELENWLTLHKMNWYNVTIANR